MKRYLRLLSAVVPGMVLFLTATQVEAVPLSQAKIIIEVNATAGDGGIQIFLDGEGWNQLEVTDPNGEKVFDVRGTGSVGMTGITELFFESAEPSFEELPLDELLERFDDGSYRFAGKTVDGKRLTGTATLRHNIPNGPEVLSPEEDEALDPGEPVVIEWSPVTSPFPGTSLPITIAGYQVIVEREKPTPLLQFSVTLPATSTKVTVPAEYLQPDAEYKFEVLAIEQSGNQTITESVFTTTAASAGRAGMDDNDEPNRDNRSGAGRAGFLRQHPNPFNPTTTLEFELPQQGMTTVRVMDVHGRLVRTLVSGPVPVGRHSATWDGRNEHGRAVSSGVYIAELKGPGVSLSTRMILAK